MNIVVSRAGDWRTNGRPVCQAVPSEPCFLRFPGTNDELKVSIALQQSAVVVHGMFCTSALYKIAQCAVVDNQSEGAWDNSFYVS